jgi:hypothetical protein
MLKLLNNSKNSLPHTFSNFNVETLNNLKNSLLHTLNLKLKLKDLKNTLPHLRAYNTLKKSIPHLPLTWKSCKLLVCHHLEMNPHLLCKLKIRLSKRFSPFFYVTQAQKPFTIYCSNTMFFLLLGVGP